jgi:DNA-binding NtrC family response regulator
MSVCEKRILIVDEGGFVRVCSAILKFEGYDAEVITGVDNLASRLDNNEFGLIIMNYPYSTFLFREFKQRKIPVIILSDDINNDLINALESFNNSYGMIKPLDYQKFRTLVKQVMSGEEDIQEGYNIV